MLSRSVMSNSLWLHGLAKLLRPWDFPGKNTGAGCHFPLQGIFPAQGSKPGLLYLLHWQVDSLPRQGPETLICVSWLVSHTHTPEVATAINATFPVRTPRHREVKSAGELPSRNVSIRRVTPQSALSPGALSERLLSSHYARCSANILHCIISHKATATTTKTILSVSPLGASSETQGQENNSGKITELKMTK